MSNQKSLGTGSVDSQSLYYEMCIRYPDRFITLFDSNAHVMERSAGARVSTAMKYTIEIVRLVDDGTHRVLPRFASRAVNSELVKAKAEILLRRALDANGYRIANHRGEEVYCSRKDSRFQKAPSS